MQDACAAQLDLLLDFSHDGCISVSGHLIVRGPTGGPLTFIAVDKVHLDAILIHLRKCVQLLRKQQVLAQVYQVL